jgi:outer membrane protein assembly factor BamB
VVARRTHDGEVVWRKWLGEPLQRMNGWTRGATSGLLRVGDLLIVPYGKLRAVSAATGEEVWTDNQPWKHFGTPAVVHADGEPLLATPGGRILRARDGTVVADQLVPNVYYTSPLVDGDRVVWLGHGLQYRDGSHVWAYDVAEDGTTTPVFDAAIDTDHRFFATPLSWRGSLWTVSELGEVWQLSGTDGSVQSRVSLEMKQVFSSPTQLGGRILILGDDGARLVDPSTGAVTHGATATTRNSPAIDARCNAYLRSLDSLVRVSLPQ